MINPGTNTKSLMQHPAHTPKLTNVEVLVGRGGSQGYKHRRPLDAEDMIGPGVHLIRVGVVSFCSRGHRNG